MAIQRHDKNARRRRDVALDRGTAAVARPLARFLDIAGGVGVIAPMLTGIVPRLTVGAAAGCAALQICAMVFHASRAEFGGLPVNAVFLALAVFILVGRRRG